MFLFWTFTQLPKVRFEANIHQVFEEENESQTYFDSIQNQFLDSTSSVLLVLKAEESIFNKAFFDSISDLTDSLQSLNFVQSVYSISNIRNENALTNELFLDRNYSIDDIQLFKKTKDVYSRFVCRNAMYTAMHVRIIPNPSDTQIKKMIRFVKESGLNYSLINSGVSELDYHEQMKVDLRMLYGIALLLIIVVLFFYYRSVLVVIFTLIIVILTTLFTLSFYPLLGFSLHPITMMVPTIASVIALSDIIHLLSAYQNNKGIKLDRIVKAKADLKKPVFLTSLTTIVGFLGLSFGWHKPLVELGVSVSIAAIFGYVLTLYFLPLLLMNCRALTHKFSVEKDIKVHSKLNLVIAAVIFAAMIFSSFQIKNNVYLFEDISSDHDLSLGLQIVEKNFSGIRNVRVEVGSELGFDNESEVLKLQQLEVYGDSIFQWGLLDSYLVDLRRNNRWFYNGDPTAFIITDKVIGLPDPQKVTPDFKSTVIIAKVEDIGSRLIASKEQSFINFAEQLGLTVKFKGRDHVFDQTSLRISEQLIFGLFVALFVVSLVMIFIFKNWKIALVSLIVNIYPLVLLLGVMPVLGINLNITSAAVFTIAFGIAVDDTIHIVTGYSRTKNIEIAMRFVGVPILRTSIVLVLGFGVLMFSSFPSVQKVGMLLSLSLVFALVGDLILLPALIKLFKVRI